MSELARFRRVSELFDHVRSMSRVERIEFLRNACVADVSIVDDVEMLLRHHDDEQGVLDTPPLGATILNHIRRPSGLPGSEWEPSALPGSELPARIGCYQILSQLGEGGMGIVYLAEQENPRRRVAVKVIRPGVLSPEVLRRFELEAAVLARLQHPGIAQIYEAGVDDDHKGSQPFFAMEYVNGVSLKQYVAERKLVTQERLELFALICDAVHHAHQKGVIHRDLKPGNILVVELGEVSRTTTPQCTAQPKILDFGVARVADADFPFPTLFTDAGRLIGTLPYMSPEQVEGQAGRLDGRSDIYSLGVILYELLTDQLPYDVAEKSVAACVRIISESEAKPLRIHNRSVGRDLTTITLKALEKDPQSRYQTCSELASDIRRFLRNEPVIARPATTAYQLRKFTQRNKVLVGGVIAVLGALILGIIGTSLGMLTARRREREAIEQREIAQAVTGFLNDDLLGSANPYRSEGPEVRVRTVLDHAATTIHERFADQPLVRAAIHTTLGRSYQGLGLYDESAIHLANAFDTHASVLGADHQETIAVRNRLASVLLSAFRLDDAQLMVEETVRLSETALGPRHEQTAAAYVNHAILLKHRGRFADAEQLYRRALDGYRDSVGAVHRRTLIAMNNLGLALSDQGKYDEAESLYRELLDLRREVSGPRHPDTAYVMINLGHVLWIQSKDMNEVEFLWQSAFEIRCQVLGDEHHDTLTSLYSVALVKNKKGEFTEAERLQRQIIEARTRSSRDDNYWVLVSRHALANTLVKQDRLDEALAIFRDVLSKSQRALGIEHHQSRRARDSVITVLKELGDDASIRTAMSEYLAALQRQAESPKAAASVVGAWAWQLLTIEPIELRDPPLALYAAQRAAEMTQRRDADVLDTLARALADNQRVAEAIAVQREAILLVPESNQRLRTMLQKHLDGLTSRDEIPLSLLPRKQ